MKKIVTIIALMFTCSFAFSQNSASISVDQLKSAKASGIYDFLVSESITSEKVDAVKGYYKEYMTVTFDEKTDNLHVALTENATLNIHVINRLLVALDIRSIQISGTETTFQDMYDQYLK
ncbi:MAG TPA: hypothetical protein PLI97_11905 [Fluviicola sp.]|nr:hypothetical protein [Fluviicola sp.]